jgi:hypothetical protein
VARGLKGLAAKYAGKGKGARSDRPRPGGKPMDIGARRRRTKPTAQAGAPAYTASAGYPGAEMPKRGRRPKSRRGYMHARRRK